MSKQAKLIAEVEVKCVFCKAVWWVGPDPSREDMPGCPKCHGFGVSTGKARTVKESK